MIGILLYCIASLIPTHVLSLSTPISGNKNKVVWFRSNSLRVKDNVALHTAVQESKIDSSSIIPIYLWNNHIDTETGGTAKDVFVVNAIKNLNNTLSGNLQVGLLNTEKENIDGASCIVEELTSICQKVDADEVFYLKSHNDDFEEELVRKFAVNNLSAKGFPSSSTLLDYSKEKIPWTDIILEHHPWRSPLIPYVNFVLKKLKENPIDPPLPKPIDMEKILIGKGVRVTNKPVDIKEFMKRVGFSKGGENWGSSISQSWSADEDKGAEILESFIQSLKKKEEDTKTTHFSSMLSPYLARGMVSSRQVYDSIIVAQQEGFDVDSFIRRICWRDYTYAVLKLYPDILQGRVIREAYYINGEEEMGEDKYKLLQLWKEGNTGFPLIDAGQRQLISEGYMPQKVRLATSTFLVEGLGVSWRLGMDHFREFLVDYDEAINTNMWMNAGMVGFDPYYVGLNFKKRSYWDKGGDYIRKYVPELKKLPDYCEVTEPKRGVGTHKVDCLYEPWVAPKEVLEEAGVILGETYAERIFDVRKGRKNFLASLRKCRSSWTEDMNLIDEGKRDVVSLGRGPNAERIGIFTPKMIK